MSCNMAYCEDGWTLLHRACYLNNIQWLHKLLASNEPNISDKYGRTPCMIAAKYGRLDCIVLLSKSAISRWSSTLDVNAVTITGELDGKKFQGRTALDFAVETDLKSKIVFHDSKPKECIAFLIKLGALRSAEILQQVKKPKSATKKC